MRLSGVPSGCGRSSGCSGWCIFYINCSWLPENPPGTEAICWCQLLERASRIVRRALVVGPGDFEDIGRIASPKASAAYTLNPKP